MDADELVKRAMDGTVIGNGTAQIAALVDRITFIEGQHAARLEAIQYAIGNGGSAELKKVAFAIITNGNQDAK